MARSRQRANRGFGSMLLGLINPIRDPSLLVAIILTVITEGSAGDPAVKIAIIFVAWWGAVKSFIWLVVNLVFSSIFLLRKTGWIIRNPRLAWRLLDALGTEEIIIGGLRPDMFATEDGGLHDGQMGAAMTGGPQWYGGLPSGPAFDQGQGYNHYEDRGYAREPVPSLRLDAAAEELQDLLSAYARLISDWTSFTEEKWRTVSDSQLGWKPLRGRWNGWDEIYQDSFAVDPNDPMAQAAEAAGEAMMRRFNNARDKGSAASSVACFLRDLDTLRQSLALLDMPDAAGVPRMGGIGPQQPISQKTGKSPIIRNPMIVDAD
ncbi:MAG TPA: hypothetical protein VF818_10080 [Ktedonobacterales bacterium]